MIIPKEIYIVSQFLLDDPFRRAFLVTFYNRLLVQNDFSLDLRCIQKRSPAVQHLLLSSFLPSLKGEGGELKRLQCRFCQKVLEGTLDKSNCSLDFVTSKQYVLKDNCQTSSILLLFNSFFFLEEVFLNTYFFTAVMQN